VLEYWIVDYAGLGGVQCIGFPKRPTITIDCLVEGEYRGQLYQGEAAVLSPTFPQLSVTTDQMVAMTED
jgi:Uma2 family endonuclease